MTTVTPQQNAQMLPDVQGLPDVKPFPITMEQVRHAIRLELLEHEERLKATFASALDEAFARWFIDGCESDGEPCSGEN